jgi:hypothetical protein
VKRETSLLPVPLVLQMRPALEMTDDQFFDFCQLNRDYRFERSAQGELVIILLMLLMSIYRVQIPLIKRNLLAFLIQLRKAIVT